MKSGSESVMAVDLNPGGVTPGQEALSIILYCLCMYSN